MTSRRYQTTLNRQQDMLLPPRIEEYVSQNNPVRVIDAYVSTLDLHELGFNHTQPMKTAGQPPFDPAALLKLYLYGYIQGIRSSRKLERETCRNLEVIWLIEGVRPSYKTIADFRRGNSAALKATNRDFILLCKELSLLGGKELAVDGSFFKADASKASIHTQNKLNKQIEYLENKITAYQKALAQQDAADDKAGKGSLIEDDQLAEKLQLLQEKQAEKQRLRQELKGSGDKQLSMVDKDARILSKRGQSIAGYNVQIAVDGKHKLIAAEDVTQDGNDSQQLSPMLKKAQDILQSEALTGLADAGYYEGRQLKACEEQQITVYVAIPDKSQAKEGCLTRDQFTYDAEQDCYYCPQGNRLAPRGKPHQKNGKWMTRYTSKAQTCHECLRQDECLGQQSKIKQIQRWEHESVVTRHKMRMEQNPNTMKRRSAIVEHPFGILKQRAGMHHFLMRGLEKCQGEFSLMVLGYNFTRVVNILGIAFLRDYFAQRAGPALKNIRYA